MFNQSVVEENKKRGIWLALGLLYKPSDFQLWEMFIDWLLQMSYYNEDDTVFRMVMNCGCDVQLDGSFFEIDKAIGWIQLKTNPQFAVFLNILNVVNYLADVDMSNGFPYFYSVLPSEYKESISKYKPETSKNWAFSPILVIILFKYMWRSSLAAATFNLCTNSMVDKETVCFSVYCSNCLEAQCDRQSRLCDSHDPARDESPLRALERLFSAGGAGDPPTGSQRRPHSRGIHRSGRELLHPSGAKRHIGVQREREKHVSLHSASIYCPRLRRSRFGQGESSVGFGSFHQLQPLLVPKGKHVSLFAAQSLHLQRQHHRVQAQSRLLHRLRRRVYRGKSVQGDGLLHVRRSHARRVCHQFEAHAKREIFGADGSVHVFGLRESVGELHPNDAAAERAGGDELRDHDRFRVPSAANVSAGHSNPGEQDSPRTEGVLQKDGSGYFYSVLRQAGKRSVGSVA